MVLKIFAALAGLVKVRESHTFVDSHVFRMHYQWTTSLCFISCALVAATEYIGNPIQCMSGTSAAPKVINTYCWITSTFTVNSTTKHGQIPGLGNTESHMHEETYHAYYQWVPFVLFFQGCLFYLPHLLWKSNERKTADSLLQGLNHNSLDKDIEAKKENIINYLKATKGKNFKYNGIYFACEVLNLVNVMGQMFLLNAFFGGAFMSYGSNVLKYMIDEIEGDPFVSAFPKVTQCTFRKFGPSGTVEYHRPLCVLPQNILNEKVFVIMWFWFVCLTTISCLELIWRLVISLTPVTRIYLFNRTGKMHIGGPLEKAIQRLHLGDFFLLDILGRNLDALTFKDILEKAVLDKDSNANNGIYAPMRAPEDDDDPVSLKRRMEEVSEGESV